jgi:hypothetical protein
MRRGPHDEFRIFIRKKETRLPSPISFSHMWRHNKKVAIYKPERESSLENCICQPLELGLPSFQNSKKQTCLSHADCG